MSEWMNKQFLISNLLTAFYRKLNKIWVAKCSEFYNRSMKQWSQDNDVEMYSTHNEGKSAVTVRFGNTLKNKTYKYITSISKNVYIDKLVDIVNKCNNEYNSAIKMKPVKVMSSTYIDFNAEKMRKVQKLSWWSCRNIKI